MSIYSGSSITQVLDEVIYLAINTLTSALWCAYTPISHAVGGRTSISVGETDLWTYNTPYRFSITLMIVGFWGAVVLIPIYISVLFRNYQSTDYCVYHYGRVENTFENIFKDCNRSGIKTECSEWWLLIIARSEKPGTFQYSLLYGDYSTSLCVQKCKRRTHWSSSHKPSHRKHYHEISPRSSQYVSPYKSYRQFYFKMSLARRP